MAELEYLQGKLRDLQITSMTQSKHLAQALKEKNNAHELLDIERRRHERHMNDLQREASRRLASVVEVNTRNDYLVNLIASATYLQPQAPIVIESKELFERNQSLQKEIEQYRVEVKKLRDFNGNQYDTIRKMRERMDSAAATLVKP